MNRKLFYRISLDSLRKEQEELLEKLRKVQQEHAPQGFDMSAFSRKYTRTTIGIAGDVEKVPADVVRKHRLVRTITHFRLGLDDAVARRLERLLNAIFDAVLNTALRYRGEEGGYAARIHNLEGES